MAYTQVQWNKIQSTLDPDARVPYLEYLKDADPVQYAKLTKSSPLQSFRTSESATTSRTDSAVQQNLQQQHVLKKLQKMSAFWQKQYVLQNLIQGYKLLLLDLETEKLYQQKTKHYLTLIQTINLLT